MLRQAFSLPRNDETLHGLSMTNRDHYDLKNMNYPDQHPSSKGRNAQLARQIGEHLAVAELGRKGYIATPFAGNVPDFDILAVNSQGKSLPIQVKAIRGSSWQLSIDKFFDINMEDKIQEGKEKLIDSDLICIFVNIKEQSPDDFYIFQLKNLQQYFQEEYFKRNDQGILRRERTKNPQSKHCAVWPKDISQYKNNWDLIKKAFGLVANDKECTL